MPEDRYLYLVKESKPWSSEIEVEVKPARILKETPQFYYITGWGIPRVKKSAVLWFTREAAIEAAIQSLTGRIDSARDAVAMLEEKLRRVGELRSAS